MNVAAALTTMGGAAVPLREVEILAEVLGAHAHARVRQTYRNDEARPVEAVYTFPLPTDATLTGFTMTCAGRALAGEVKERDAAFTAYDDAVSAGHGAALLDQERPNVFTASVGNLLPGEETVIEIAYVQRVQADEGMVRWSVPTLVAPRYVPGVSGGARTAHGVAEPTDRVPDADRISPPTGDARYGLRLDVMFDLGADVIVESPSHALVVTRSATGALVRARLAQRDVALDRDIVVTARGASASAPLTACVTHDEPAKDGYFALTVVPDLLALHADAVAVRQEVVFVVDVSGSMQGDSIEQARSALLLCLRHLREGDRFNIVAFNESLHRFEREAVAFTQTTLARADAWVEALRASGGTEMLAPLVDAVRMVPSGVVVLLTDGQVGNEDEILADVLSARVSARVYSFGIGTNVSDALLRGLARNTGGAVEMIHPGERIDDKVIAQFARATAARVTDVTITWEGVDVGEIAPAELSPLVDGEPWTVLGRFEQRAVGRATIRGKLRGEAFALECPVDLARGTSRPALAPLWAAERVRDLEGVELVGRRAAANKERIVRLAVEHQIASRYTSFVVTERRSGDRRASGQPETRVIPVSLPAGWGGAPRSVAGGGATRGGTRGRPYVNASVARGSGAMPFDERTRGPAWPAAGPPRSAVPPRIAEPSPVAPAAPLSAMISPPAPARSVRSAERTPSTAPPDPIVALLARQLASGLWDDPAGAGPEPIRRVRATARALADLVERGVTTLHAVHGAQVRKAIDALLVEVAALASASGAEGADDLRILEMALAAAWLAASGPRTRAAIERLVASAAPLGALRGHMNEATLRARVRADALGG